MAAMCEAPRVVNEREGRALFKQRAAGLASPDRRRILRYALRTLS